MKTETNTMYAQAINVQPEGHGRKQKSTINVQSASTSCSLALALLVVLTTVCSLRAQQLAPLNIGDSNHGAHVLPLPGEASLRQNQPTGSLTFKGGPVMGAVDTYAIFWRPPTLQDGTPTGMPGNYRGVLQDMLRNYSGHGIDNNNTQYYSNCVGIIDLGGGGGDYTCVPFWGWGGYYIPNAGSLKASYLDTTSYPASGCNDPATPGNCINDAQIRAEIQHVMSLKGWTGGLNKVFLLFTSSGEGSCFDNGPIYCSYNFYCAYHSDINVSGTAIVYGNEPYGDPGSCQLAGTPSPNNNPAADTAATAASHELTEAITDPLPDVLPAWQTSGGAEIGDLCAYQYGPNTWDGNQANQMWNGLFFELQMEYDDHTSSCVQVGP